MNLYSPHLIVVPEDDVNCEIALGFNSTRDEPQDLNVELRDSSFESIGKKLAKACESNLMNSEWNAKQLNQNAEELARLQVIVRPMLF